MSKNYVPTMVTDVHQLRMYLARYGAILRPAMALLVEDGALLFDALQVALIAIDDLSSTLHPTED